MVLESAVPSGIRGENLVLPDFSFKASHEEICARGEPVHLWHRPGPLRIPVYRPRDPHVPLPVSGLIVKRLTPWGQCQRNVGLR
jgi:hypothetical protein